MFDITSYDMLLSSYQGFVMDKKKVLMTYIESGFGHITSITSISDNFKKIYGNEFDVDDSLVWKNTANGDLSFKNVYNLILKPSPSSSWSSFPWDKDTHPSHSMVFGDICIVKLLLMII